MFSGTGSSKTALRREDTGRGPRAYQEDLRDRTGQNPGSDALQTCQQGHIVLQDRRRPLRITRAQGHHGRCADAYHGGRLADNRDSKRGLVLRPLLLWLLSSWPRWHVSIPFRTNMLEQEGVSITTAEDTLVFVLHSAHPVDFVLDGSPGGTP